MRDYLTSEANKHLQNFCGTITERAVGTKGNREATKYFSEYLKKRDFKIDALKFDCMDWKTEGAKLIIENKESVIQPSPYTVPYKGTAELVVISEKFELKEKNLKGKIGLLMGMLLRSNFFLKISNSTIRLNMQSCMRCLKKASLRRLSALLHEILNWPEETIPFRSRKMAISIFPQLL